jgi:deoxyribonuclease-1
MIFLVTLLIMLYPNLTYSDDFKIKNTSTGNNQIKSFSTAKKLLKKTDYLGIKNTVYCGCPIIGDRYLSQLCGLKHGTKFLDRVEKIEIEHIVPISEITKNTVEYKEGSPTCGSKKGRACIEKVYGFLSGDLWNLLPSEAIFNQIHKNYSWAEIPGEERIWGSCDFEFKDKKVEPPEYLKGLIARTYLYFEETYQIKVISEKNKSLFEVWSKLPPKKWQCDRAKQIIRFQKNINILEVKACSDNGFL